MAASGVERAEKLTLVLVCERSSVVDALIDGLSIMPSRQLQLSTRPHPRQLLSAFRCTRRDTFLVIAGRPDRSSGGNARSVFAEMKHCWRFFGQLVKDGQNVHEGQQRERALPSEKVET